MMTIDNIFSMTYDCSTLASKMLMSVVSKFQFFIILNLVLALAFATTFIIKHRFEKDVDGILDGLIVANLVIALWFFEVWLYVHGVYVSRVIG